jgi:hypothetical protein
VISVPKHSLFAKRHRRGIWMVRARYVHGEPFLYLEWRGKINYYATGPFRPTNPTRKATP